MTADSLRRSSEQQLADRANQISHLMTSGPPIAFPDLPVGPAFGGPESGTVAIVVEPDGTAHGLGNLPACLPIADAVDAAWPVGGGSDEVVDCCRRGLRAFEPDCARHSYPRCGCAEGARLEQSVNHDA